MKEQSLTLNSKKSTETPYGVFGSLEGEESRG